ncbi:MAG TPA: hypothetical protein DCF68_14330 [Cyanothece sp. UBA12306]|nr:hypothetical protein [Cyanothece sp. UBA12306]
MQISSDSFDEMVQYLEHHQESLRIKKLIFCLSQKSWQNNPDILNSFSLNDLILELVQVIPDRDQFKFSLVKLVKSLNRPKVYAAVAKVILSRIDDIYLDHNQIPELISEEAESSFQSTHITDQEFLLEQAVSSLNNHEQSDRIKKLIFAICHEQWENNLDKINAYGLKNLIQETLEKYPTKPDIEFAFNQLIGKINKKNLYLAISKVILNQLEGFYKNLSEEVDSETNTALFNYGTQIIPLGNSHNIPQKSAQSNFSREIAFETSVIDITSEQMKTELQPIKAVPVPPPTPKRKTYDIFELRLQIMQYSNPLQAKILLFSLLFHPWDRSGQDWSMLRSYTLDDLLEQLIQSGKSVVEMESKLYTAAKSLRDDSDTALQTASSILETVKPFL